MVHIDAFLRRARLILTALPLLAGVTGCRQEVAFTQMAPVGTIEETTTPTTTTLFAAVPVDLAAMRADVDRELPEKLARIVKWVENAACDRRPTGYDCTAARVEADIVRKGPVTVAATPTGRLAITIPFAYDLQARGRNWASGIAERKTGEVTVTLEFEAGLGADYAADVRPLADAVFSIRTVTVLKAELDLAREIEPRIQRALIVASAGLKRQLTQLPLREAATRVWSAVQQPIELISNRRMWLRGEPEWIYSGGFGRDNSAAAGRRGDAVTFRVAIHGRVGVWVDERPAPLIARPMPTPLRGQVAGQSGNMKSRLRLPYYIDLESAMTAVAGRFPATEVIETRADAVATPVKVRVSRVQVFPSRQMLGFEVTLDVVQPANWLGLEGRAHLVGRPVFMAETQEIGLENIGFPLYTQRPGKPGQKAVRIGEKPFTDRIAAAFRLDATRLLEEAKRQAGSAFDLAMADDITMSGRFEAVSVSGLTPVRDGLAIAIDLDGVVTFQLDPDALRAAASHTTMSASATVGPTGRPKTTGSVTPAGGKPAAIKP